MRYWVYGVDVISREPRDPLFIDAVNEAEARTQAKEMGMAAEDVEAVQPKANHPTAPAASVPGAPVAESYGPDDPHRMGRFLVRVFRIAAVFVAFLYLILFFTTMDAASKAEEMAKKLGSSAGVSSGPALLRVILEAVLVVSLLLAVSEFLRLGIALERNTRGRAGTGPGEKRRPR